MQENAEELLSRYLNGEHLSDKEKALIETWYIEHKSIDQKSDEQLNRELKFDQKESLTKLLTEIKSENKTRLWPRYATVAACALIALGIAHQLSIKPVKYAGNSKPKSVVATNELMPGHNKVVITLSTGRHIMLDDNDKKRQIANEEGTIIDQKSKGLLSYEGTSKDSTLYNVATTPRGGTYQLALSDGTKVWLNAETTLKYPVSFSGNTRKVEVTGEAYFEVAHDPIHPFVVVSGNQAIKVLGTHFNVKAYTDEKNIATTLLEGSISLSYNGKLRVIKPGEQARFDGKSIAVERVNSDDVIAWKRGYFLFKNANIDLVMREFSRWYDVDIEFQGQIPDRRFSGGISREIKGTELLNLLTFKNIHYTLKGRTIIITP